MLHCGAKIKKYVSYNKKTIAVSIITFLLFAVGWKLLKREVSIKEKPVIYLVALDTFLCGMLMFKFKTSAKFEKYFALVLFVVVPMICFWNTESIIGNTIFSMSPIVLCVNYGLYLTVFLILQLILNSIKWSLSCGMILFTIFGIADVFVGKFRGKMISSSDILAIKTAMNVASGYELVFDMQMIVGILISFATILVIAHCEYKEKSLKRRAIKGSIIILYVCVFISVIFNKDFLLKHNIKPDWWYYEESIKAHGGFLDFAAGIPFLILEEPEGYSAKEADFILKEAQTTKSNEMQSQKDFHAQTPDIIVIMNESFSDLKYLGDFETTRNPIKNFEELLPDTIHGRVSVEVSGGGTCNTEFEMLTGYTTSFFPGDVYPFLSYVNDKTDNLGRQLKENGYFSIFMHPHDKNGWNRKNVYDMFGFDKSLFIEDFQEIELLRYFPSDTSNYKNVIEQYEIAKEKNESIFLFNVTMQNHGGYVTGLLDNEIEIVGQEDKYPKTEEWITLIEESDKAFKELIDYFENRKNPVLVCMFGDHLPTIENEFMEELLDKKERKNEEKTALRYQTPFAIWANYEIDKREYENISANYLSTILLETAGIPINEYQNYLKELYMEYPVITVNGVKDKNGNWYSWEEAYEFDKIREYEKIQYRSMFDK